MLDKVTAPDSHPPAPSAPAHPLNLGIWLAQTASRLPGAMAAIIVLANKESARFELHSTWPHQLVGKRLLTLAERCLEAMDTVVQPEPGILAVAVMLGPRERASGVLVVELAAGALTADDSRQAVLAAARYLDHIMLGQTGRRDDDRGAAWLASRKELLQLVCSPAPFAQCALDVVNALAASFSCTRVGLGLDHGGQVRLLALSHSAWFDRKSAAVHAIENAMDEALDQRATVVLPCPREAGTMTAAHRALGAGLAVCSVILAGGDGLGHGVLYLERAPDHPFSSEEIAALEEIGQLIGPVLETKDAAQRWIGGRLRHAYAQFAARLRDPRRPGLRAGMAAGVLALAGLTLLEVGWNINAEAVIEGEQQRVVAAPFEGFIASSRVKAGLVVRKGQALAELDTRQLRLDAQRWAAEEAQADSRYRDALARHDRPAAAMAAAQMQQAQAQRALADEQLSKAALVAPFDAYVVAGDLSQQIGSPVEQGKVLFELAPLHAYRVILRVDERDIRAVKPGQRGRLVLSGLTQERLGLEVINISLPEAVDGRNVFRVEARLDQAGTTLRPGMQGVAKIAAGERSLWWIWTHSAWDWLRLQAWKWSL